MHSLLAGTHTHSSTAQNLQLYKYSVVNDIYIGTVMYTYFRKMSRLALVSIQPPPQWVLEVLSPAGRAAGTFSYALAPNKC